MTWALELLQLRALRLRLLEDGEVGVGDFPNREEILIGGAGLGEGGLLWHGRLARVALVVSRVRDGRATRFGFECVRAGEAETRHRTL